MNDQWEIRGIIRNDQERPLEETKVAVTFYDAAGKVSYATDSFAPNDFVIPGESTSFSVRAPVGFAYDHYTVQTEGFFATIP